MKKLRIIMYQKPLGIPISHRDTEEMAQFKPDFICFPEYFFVMHRRGNHGQTKHNQSPTKKENYDSFKIP